MAGMGARCHGPERGVTVGMHYANQALSIMVATML